MKKILVLMAVLLVAVLVFSIPAAAQAASNKNTTAAAVRPSLAIKAPPAAFVGEKVKMKVVGLPGGAPAVKAEVWAVDIKNGGPVPVISTSQTNGVGVFLGWTDKLGEITSIFQDPGRYLLIAFKNGFAPGFAWIDIQPLKKMALKGLQSALVGQTCEFIVYEPDGGAAVAGAGVWAISIQNESTLPQDMASYVTSQGEFLGWTNHQGKVFHAFDKAGRYFLAAVKTGYIPAFGKILIKELKELAIRNPPEVWVLEPVTIRTVEKSVLTVEIPVSGVGVWALSTGDKATLDDVTDYAALVEKDGLFLGWTNKDGYVSPEPRFNNAGQYWLVAIKDGYVPAISEITVRPLLTATPGPLPVTAKPAAASAVSITSTAQP